MSANNSPQRAPLDWREWDFGPSRLPQDELAACHAHEYGREVAKRCPYVLTQLTILWRANELPKKYQPPGDLSGASLFNPKPHPKPHPDRIRGTIAWDKLRSFDIPLVTLGRRGSENQSWYSLSEHIRSDAVKRLLRKRKLSKTGDLKCLSIHTIRELQPSRITTMELFKWYGDEFLRRNEPNDGQVEYGFFRIDWNCGVGVLKNEFARWLGQHQEELKKNHLVAQRKPSRGQLRDQMRWLGALRVKEYYPRGNLVDYPHPSLKVCAPYLNLPDLYVAARAASKIIGKRIGRITKD